MKDKRVYLLCLASAMLLLFVCTPMSVPAQTPHPQGSPPFQFSQQDEVKLTWEDVKRGKAIVQVLNNTATQHTLSVAIGDMGFQALDGQNLGTPKVLKPQSETITLPPSQGVPVTFLVQDGVRPKEGTYSGFLHVSETAADTAIHLRITLTVPALDREGTTMLGGELPVPLVDSWKVQYFRCAIPIRGLERLWLPRNVFLPLDVDHNKGEAIALDPNEPLGYLTDPDQGMATVSWVGQPQVQPNNKLGIELAFTGLDNPGEYKGEIDLVPDDEKKGLVSLTVTVTDFVLWPILVIFLGILGAIWIQQRIGVNRNILTLYEDEANTYTLNGGDQYKGYSIIDFEWKRKKIRDAVGKLRDKHRLSTVTLGPENEEYKAIVDSLKKLDEHVEGWNAFGDELAALEAALDKVSDVQPDGKKEYLHHPDHVEKPPHFKGAAKTLLKGGRLAFEEKKVEADEGIQAATAEDLFETRRQKVTAGIKLAQSWQGWVDRLVRARKALQELQGTAAPELKKAVRDARFELARVETVLWEAPDLDALEAAEMEKSLRMAEGLVAGLKSYEGLPEGWAKLEELKLFPVQPLIPYPIPSKLPVEHEKRLAFIQRTLYRSDWLMFWLALLGGVYTGLTTLYCPQPFGTPLDYAKAFAWGFGAKATLEVVYAAINRLVRVAD